MTGFEIIWDQKQGAPPVVRLEGALTTAHLSALVHDLAHVMPFEEKAAGPLAVDLGAVSHIDTGSAWALERQMQHWRAQGWQVRLVGESRDAAALLARIGAHITDTDAAPESEEAQAESGFVAQTGSRVLALEMNAIDLLAFFGQTLRALGRVIVNPARLRWAQTVQQVREVGVESLAIIGLMSFLVGIVIAQQGSVQLRQFGAQIFTVNLLGRSVVRELGVLMTSIMVAGRSGSAFAAQIGSMKLAEEVEALRAMGVRPIEILALPRIIATIAMMPLLSFYAIICGLAGGGLFVWFSLGVPPVQFIAKIHEVVPMTDLWITLIKAPVFGAIIAIVGCFRGFLVSGDARSVGLNTTTSVVMAIFLVIVFDALFAVFFTAVGWV